MKSKLYEAINKIQQEYFLMLKKYKNKINDNNFVQIVDEVSIFWNKNKTIVDAFFNFETPPYNTYVFTAVTRMDYDDNEHLPFLCLGSNHIMDDPLCTYLNTVNESPLTTYTKRLRMEIEKTIDDNIKIIEKCSPSIYIIPIRYLYSDRELVKRKSDECFLSLFNGNFNSLEDYFKLESIEQIDLYLREEIKDSLVFLEYEDKTKPLIERFCNYKDVYANDLVGSDNDVILFFAAIYGNISQSIDVIIIALGLKLVPYLRNEIAIRYFLTIAENIKTWYKDIDNVIFNAGLANLLYNKFDKEKYADYSTEKFIKIISDINFEQAIRSKLISDGIDSLNGNIREIVAIIKNEFDALNKTLV